VPGAGGLTLLPYLDGERTPDLPDATGVLAGLRSDVRREQLARATVEGVVCGLLDAPDALVAEVPAVEVIFLTGLRARSRVVREVLADLCDMPVSVTSVEESVATGACLQAAATVLDVDHAEVAERWRLGGAAPVAPSGTVGDALRGDVRGRYAELRARQYG
jgi:xylulokinase